MPFRGQWINAYATLNMELFQSIDHSGVVIGKENWLFYTGNESLRITYTVGKRGDLGNLGYIPMRYLQEQEVIVGPFLEDVTVTIEEKTAHQISGDLFVYEILERNLDNKKARVKRSPN